MVVVVRLARPMPRSSRPQGRRSTTSSPEPAPTSRARRSAHLVWIGTAVSTLSLAALGGLAALDAGQWFWLVVAGVTTGVATACTYAALARADASRVAVVLALRTGIALALGA